MLIVVRLQSSLSRSSHALRCSLRRFSSSFLLSPQLVLVELELLFILPLEPIVLHHENYVRVIERSIVGLRLELSQGVPHPIVHYLFVDAKVTDIFVPQDFDVPIAINIRVLSGHFELPPRHHLLFAGRLPRFAWV